MKHGWLQSNRTPGMPADSSEHRVGFSLVELIVAMGILVLMMALAGQVFSVTVRSTGQATALTTVNQDLRAFERMLREDLRHVHAGSSLIVIEANPINAYWTQDGRDSDSNGDPSDGYPHLSDSEREDADGNMLPPRADILMLFTARTATSATNPGVSSDLQQVVYGHARLGEYEPVDGGSQPYAFVPDPEAFPVLEDGVVPGLPDPEAVSPTPADQWHLANRRVLLMETPAPLASTGAPGWIRPDEPDCGDGIPCSDDEGNYRPFDAHRILQGETDVVSEFSFDEMVLTPANPPQPNGWTTTGKKAWYLPAIFNGLGTRPFARSELDLTPPAPVGDRIGHYFLPHCLSFKVEWALDPRDPAIAGRLDSERRILWFDPADPDGQLASLKEALQDVKDADDDPQREDDLEYLLCNPLFGRDPASGVVANTERYSLWCRFEEQCPEDLCGGSCGGSCPPEGWDEVPDPPRRNFVVFGATRRMPVDPVTGAGGELVAEDVFPVALRITVDVIDARRRLERPIRKVMVIPIGG